MPAHYKDETVYLADLVKGVNPPLLADTLFERCEVRGPVVLVGQSQNNSFVGCTWDSPDLSAILWLIDETRRFLVGAIGISGVSFRDCRMIEVGIGAGRAEAEEIMRGFGAPPEASDA